MGEAVGILKGISLHRLRHSVITTALDKTYRDVRKVQKLGQRANLNTLMIDEHNRSHA